MRASMILAVLAIAASAPAAHAQSADSSAAANGKCTGPDGKDAASVKCKGAGAVPGAASSGPRAAGGSAYKLDSKGVCRDAKGKLAPADRCKV